MRLDVYLSEFSYVKSRTIAKEAIENGSVIINGKVIKKPSYQLNENEDYKIEITAPESLYVSRGGIKLEAAIKEFNIDVMGSVCADIGASTGGFTDCLLQHGAYKVYAIDSGSEQLSPILKKDKRVVNIERFNARNLNLQTIGEYCDVATADLSFISQTYVIPNVFSILKNGGVYIGLIKPQFECGREGLGKGGIVKDEKYRKYSVEKVINAAQSANFTVQKVIKSPITGGDGNIEYLFYCLKKTLN